MYFQKRRARAHPRLKSFVCIRCLSSGIFTVWSYYFIRLNLNTRKILLLPAPIPWPQATIIELDQLRSFLSFPPNIIVEKTAWPIQRHRLFLRRESFFAAIVAILDATKKKEREGEIENNKGNTFLSNFSFLELSRELSLFWDWESSEEKRAKPRESKPIR